MLGFFFMSFFLLSDPCRANFSWNKVKLFSTKSKRGFKFLLKHDWLKKVKFEINGSINLEHFVNKFHSPSLIIFLLRLLCGVKKLIHLEENKNKVYKKVSEVCFYEFLLLQTLCSFGSFVLVINILFLEKYIR